MLCYFFQKTVDIGTISEWEAASNSGGLDGRILYVLCFVMTGLMLLIAWYVKASIKSNKDDRELQRKHNADLLKLFSGIKDEMNSNAMEISKPLAELNLRLTSMEADISKIFNNQSELSGMVEDRMKDVSNLLKEAKQWLMITNETVTKKFTKK